MSASMMRTTRSSRAAGRAASTSAAGAAVPRVAFRSGCAHTGPCGCRTAARTSGVCAATFSTSFNNTEVAPAPVTTVNKWKAYNERDLNYRCARKHAAYLISLVTVASATGCHKHAQMEHVLRFQLMQSPWLTRWRGLLCGAAGTVRS